MVAEVIDGAIVVTGLNYARSELAFLIPPALPGCGLFWLDCIPVCSRFPVLPVTTSSERMMIYGKENCVLVWLLKGIDC